MLVGSQIELRQSQTNNLACRAREKRRTPRSRCLLLCVVVVIAYMLWCAVDVSWDDVSDVRDVRWISKVDAHF